MAFQAADRKNASCVGFSVSAKSCYGVSVLTSARLGDTTYMCLWSESLEPGLVSLVLPDT